MLVWVYRGLDLVQTLTLLIVVVLWWRRNKDWRRVLAEHREDVKNLLDRYALDMQEMRRLNIENVRLTNRLNYAVTQVSRAVTASNEVPQGGPNCPWPEANDA